MIIECKECGMKYNDNSRTICICKEKPLKIRAYQQVMNRDNKVEKYIAQGRLKREKGIMAGQKDFIKEKKYIANHGRTFRNAGPGYHLDK